MTTNEWTTTTDPIAADLAKVARDEVCATIMRKLSLCETGGQSIAVAVASVLAALHMAAGAFAGAQNVPIESVSLRDVANAVLDCMDEAKGETP